MHAVLHGPISYTAEIPESSELLAQKQKPPRRTQVVGGGVVQVQASGFQVVLLSLLDNRLSF